jgi:opacity protein-like surface antigen
MIHILSFCLALALCFQTAEAVDLTGTNENSFSGQFGIEKVTRHFDSPYYHDSDDYKTQFMTLVLRHGVYVYHGLEVEPELHWTEVSGLESAISFHANVAYNFTSALKSDGWRTGMPFILIGYGIGNAAPQYFTFLAKTTNKSVPVFNLGAGMKAFVSKQVAMRVEYRYQRYAYSNDDGVWHEDYVQRYHNIFFGFSIFFPPHQAGPVKPIQNG